MRRTASSLRSRAPLCLSVGLILLAAVSGAGVRAPELGGDGSGSEGASGKWICEGEDKCKSRVLKEEATDEPSCCRICKDDMGIPASHAFGADEFVGNNPDDPTGEDMDYSPLDQTAKCIGKDGEEIEDEAKKEEACGEYPGYELCMDPRDDSWKLPCCVPCGEKKRPMEVMMEFKDSDLVEELATKAAEARNPFALETQEKPKKEKTHDDIPCCGTLPSCCRWCPSLVCPRLDRSMHHAASLYDALCVSSELPAEPVEATSATLNLRAALSWTKKGKGKKGRK